MDQLRGPRPSWACAVLVYFAEAPKSTVVMEACGSAHYWAREIEQLGHTVVLLPPHQVRPCVTRNKTDRADAKGILEAYRNADIRPVPVKTIPQHVLGSIHRFRSGWIASRTAQVNTLRGLLRELGLLIPEGIEKVVPQVRHSAQQSRRRLGEQAGASRVGGVEARPRLRIDAAGGVTRNTFAYLALRSDQPDGGTGRTGEREADNNGGLRGRSQRLAPTRADSIMARGCAPQPYEAEDTCAVRFLDRRPDTRSAVNAIGLKRPDDVND